MTSIERPGFAIDLPAPSSLARLAIGAARSLRHGESHERTYAKRKEYDVEHESIRGEDRRTREGKLPPASAYPKECSLVNLAEAHEKERLCAYGRC